MKNLNDYLIDKDTDEILWKFAYLGNESIKNQRIQELADLAEYENWTSTNSTKPNNILYSYLTHTFNRAFELGNEYVIVNDDETYACFNTGLLTENGEDIICIFNEYRSSKDYKWHLNGFKKESDYDFMSQFPTTPKVVNYFSNPEDIYFDPNKQLTKNLDHILNDNLERFSDDLQSKGTSYINALLNNALDLTIKRCKRNYRIAVPQYYKGKITYLLPVSLDNQLMSVAVEKINNRYRVNTIFTLEMAYKNARLLMKPEADWLTSITQ